MSDGVDMDVTFALGTWTSDATTYKVPYATSLYDAPCVRCCTELQNGL